MVLPVSDRVSRAPPYSRISTTRSNAFVYRTFTFYGAAFQPASTSDRFFDSCPGIQLRDGLPYNPARATPECLHTNGLGYSQFARHYYGNLV